MPIDSNEKEKEKKAIQLAKKAIIAKGYSEKEFKQYSLIKSGPVAKNPAQWHLHFDIEDKTDSSIEIIVDLSTGRAVYFKNQWA
ncbi:MAG: hypothetical protein Q7R70_04915 [Candidatus Diapherotrites archaeon]|nr:hypothetical protein [Candidatus Diapherotrites archaeon]